MTLLVRLFGRGPTERVKNWIPSLALLGTTGVISGLYLIEMQTVLQYVPYVRGRYIDGNNK